MIVQNVQLPAARGVGDAGIDERDIEGPLRGRLTAFRELAPRR